MIYESQLEEKRQEQMFYDRMSIYLNSKSIHEYLVEKDIKGLSKGCPKILDEFIWWYLFKEKYYSVISWFIAMFSLSSIAFPAILWLVGLSWYYAILVSGVLAFMLTLAFYIIKQRVNELRSVDVPSSINEFNDVFWRADEKMFKKQSDYSK